jgi:hypothetical protein
MIVSSISRSTGPSIRAARGESHGPAKRDDLDRPVQGRLGSPKLADVTGQGMIAISTRCPSLSPPVILKKSNFFLSDRVFGPQSSLYESTESVDLGLNSEPAIPLLGQRHLERNGGSTGSIVGGPRD